MKSYCVVVLASLLALVFISSGGTSMGEILVSENMTSSDNITSTQAMKLGDLHGKFMKDTISVIRESKSNLTKMNEIILDRLAAKGLITDKEKETVSPYVIGLTKNDSTSNLPIMQVEVSKLLEGFFKNNASVGVIALTSVLNNSISSLNDIPITPTTRGDSSVTGWDLFCFGMGFPGLGPTYGAGAAGECSALAAEGIF